MVATPLQLFSSCELGANVPYRIFVFFALMDSSESAQASPNIKTKVPAQQPVTNLLPPEVRVYSYCSSSNGHAR